MAATSSTVCCVPRLALSDSVSPSRTRTLRVIFDGELDRGAFGFVKQRGICHRFVRLAQRIDLSLTAARGEELWRVMHEFVFRVVQYRHHANGDLAQSR